MTRPEQLPLELPVRPALGREDFLVTDANRLALQSIEQWPDWPGGKLALVGEPGAGKTHLTHVWANLSDAPIISATKAEATGLPDHIAIEDIDQLATAPDRAQREEAIFHLYNAVTARGGTMLLTGTTPPARWDIALPDLASRLQTAGIARIEPPDDTLFAALLVKLFTDRQIAIKPALITFLLPRIERSFAAAKTMVEQLDREALAQRRKVNTGLAGELLRAETVTKPSASPDRTPDRTTD